MFVSIVAFDRLRLFLRLCLLLRLFVLVLIVAFVRFHVYCWALDRVCVYCWASRLCLLLRLDLLLEQ